MITSATNARQRIIELDIARSLALFLMIVGHLDIFFNDSSYGGEGFAGKFKPIADTFSFWSRTFRIPVAPSFFILSGWLLKNKFDNGSLTFKMLAKRSIQLFILNIVIFPFWYFPNLKFGIGVLGAFSFLFLIILPFLRFSWWINSLIAILLLSLPEIFPSLYSQTSTWTNIFIIPAHVNEWFKTSYPFLPWFAVALLGVSLSSLTKLGIFHRKRELCYFMMSLIFLINFIFFSIFTSFGNNGLTVPITGVERFFIFSKYPPSFLFVLLSLSMLMLLLSATKCLNFNNKMVYFLALPSRYSLFTYTSHLVFLSLLHLILKNIFIGSAGSSIILGIGIYLLIILILHQYHQKKKLKA